MIGTHLGNIAARVANHCAVGSDVTAVRQINIVSPAASSGNAGKIVALRARKLDAVFPIWTLGIINSGINRDLVTRK